MYSLITIRLFLCRHATYTLFLNYSSSFFIVGVFYQVVFTIYNTLVSLSKLSFGFMLITS